mmetsp:Transcript_17482/g.38085  ORF Transcript_17482/g.38085 Transcript_17482/m.38085 type:complete len:209 (-) Transcript_17482:244-870(-)|eukprot:CAMPEP_0118922174 /NCGR_PEP_ID=MMETSP1169-20130426/1189_1 /TAXON_ID=36882 /ORGANISM="Pyramimonas obovata, Strain CCMP722" /LENGTH=208 /DNA_ID=CAMNT_0006863003 /DNA_START=277 /DNA_END=903 /DNA_ORIENTATION=+
MPPILPVHKYDSREEKQKQKLGSDLTNRDCGFACNMDPHRPFSDELDVFNRLLPLHVFALEEHEAPEKKPGDKAPEGEDTDKSKSQRQVWREQCAQKYRQFEKRLIERTGTCAEYAKRQRVVHELRSEEKFQIDQLVAADYRKLLAEKRAKEIEAAKPPVPQIPQMVGAQMVGTQMVGAQMVGAQNVGAQIVAAQSGQAVMGGFMAQV